MCVYAQASAGAAELVAAQAKTAAQLQALESQLASKDSVLQATEVRLAALEAELRGANSKVIINASLAVALTQAVHLCVVR